MMHFLLCFKRLLVYLLCLPQVVVCSEMSEPDRLSALSTELKQIIIPLIPEEIDVMAQTNKSWNALVNAHDVKTLIEKYAKKYSIHEWCAAALIATRVGKNIIRTELFKNEVKQYCFRKLLWKARKECKSKKLARIHVRQTRHCRDEFDAVYGQEKIIDATILPNKDIYMIMEMKIPQSSKIFEQIRKLDHSSEKRIDFHSSERMHGDTHSFRIEVTDKRILLFRRQPLDYRSSRIIVEAFTFDGRTDSSFALEGQFTISDFSSIDIDDSGQIVCNTGEDRREFSADGKEL